MPTSAGTAPSKSNSGTLAKAAKREKAHSAQNRRGPQNPNRQRQPKRVGTAGGQLATSKVAKVIKGPDLGAG